MKQQDEVKQKDPIDTDIIYDVKEFPDKVSGQCDNCGNTSFTSSVSHGILLRVCKKCGMKKSI